MNVLHNIVCKKGKKGFSDYFPNQLLPSEVHYGETEFHVGQKVECHSNVVES